MNHSFDVDHATQYGVIEAILIGNFQFWISKNKANGENLRDGRTWTYNTVKAWAALFPYLTYDKVRRALEKLETKGVLVVGNYNVRAMDQTKWYAFADENRFLVHLADSPNASGKSASANGKSAKSLLSTDVNANGNPDVGRSKRGTRLSPDWKLPRKWGVWALEDEDVNRSGKWTEAHVRLTGDRFRDHWTAVPGRQGLKLDWFGTWRNWCRDWRSAMPAARSGGGNWRASDDLALAKAMEVGVGRAHPHESRDAWHARISAAIESGGAPAAPLQQSPEPSRAAAGEQEPKAAPSDVSRAALSGAKALLKQKSAGGGAAS